MSFTNAQPGRRKLAVKVVDIFGTDTMTIVEVNAGREKIVAKLKSLVRRLRSILCRMSIISALRTLARYKDADRTDYIIQNWLRNRNTIEFLGIWEQLNNPNFNPIEFDGFKKQAGLNSFSLTAKRWIETTNAIGLISRSGRYGGTYAHKDIAFEFASWISVEFKLYLIKEFQRLKDEERKQLGWDIRRNLTKINYRVHTDAIKENLIPPKLNSTPDEPDLRLGGGYSKHGFIRHDR